MVLHVLIDLVRRFVCMITKNSCSQISTQMPTKCLSSAQLVKPFAVFFTIKR